MQRRHGILAMRRLRNRDGPVVADVACMDVPRVLNMAHTSFTVSNLDRSVAFYRDVLGLELVKTLRLREPWIAAMTGFRSADLKIAALRLGPGGHILELIEYANPAGEVRASHPTNDIASAHLCFAVDDIGAMYERLKAAGVEFRSAPQAIGGEPGNGWAVYFRDPDGIPLELAQDDHGFDVAEEHDDAVTRA